jgi:hypothetical protein
MPSARFLTAVARAVLAGSAAVSEFGAIEALPRNAVTIACAWHLLSSVLAGAFAATTRSCERRDRWFRFGFAVVLSGSVPGVGVLGVVLVVVPILSRHAAAGAPRLLCLSRPDWRDSCLAAAGRVERMLAPQRTPSQRIRLLLSQRGMPAASAVPGLRAALRDSTDEVRLLAHALIDRRETQLRVAIGAMEAELAAASADSRRRLQLLRRLAHAYWALVDGELAHGELANEALARAARFAKDALELVPRHSGSDSPRAPCRLTAYSLVRTRVPRSETSALATDQNASGPALEGCGELCLLLARVCLSQSDGLSAWHWLQRAEREQVPLDVRAMLYAEAAFLLHRFEQIPHWLRKAGMRQLCRPRLARVAALWLREQRNSSRARPSHS